jgi:hypothetical protein
MSLYRLPPGRDPVHLGGGHYLAEGQIAHVDSPVACALGLERVTVLDGMERVIEREPAANAVEGAPGLKAVEHSWASRPVNG